METTELTGTRQKQSSRIGFFQFLKELCRKLLYRWDMKKDEHVTARESLDLVEDELIGLIQDTTHQGALELLTQALMRVRAANRYLEGDEFSC